MGGPASAADSMAPHHLVARRYYIVVTFPQLLLGPDHLPLVTQSVPLIAPHLPHSTGGHDSHHGRVRHGHGPKNGSPPKQRPHQRQFTIASDPTYTAPQSINDPAKRRKCDLASSVPCCHYVQTPTSMGHMRPAPPCLTTLQSCTGQVGDLAWTCPASIQAGTPTTGTRSTRQSIPLYQALGAVPPTQEQ